MEETANYEPNRVIQQYKVAYIVWGIRHWLVTHTQSEAFYPESCLIFVVENFRDLSQAPYEKVSKLKNVSEVCGSFPFWFDGNKCLYFNANLRTIVHHLQPQGHQMWIQDPQ